MMNRRVVPGFIALLLLSVLSQAQVRMDQPITTSDGILLDATIVLPSGTPPIGGFPGIVMVHGFGGSKDEMLPVSVLLVARGYAALVYSVRGQGISGGFSTILGERERQDLREVVRYFRLVASVDSNRIGVTGASQGGVHSWMAAVDRIPGVRAVAPLLATPDFALALAPNGCMRYGLAYEMSLGSVRYGADRDRVKGFVIADQYDSVLTYIGERNLSHLLDSVQIPVFQELGWADYLFPVNGGIDAAARLTARNIPVRSYFGTNGHGEPTNSQELSFQLDQTFQWFDRWLKDIPLAQDTLPLVTYADDRLTWPHHTTTTWPPQPNQTVRLYFANGGLSTAPPGSDGVFPFTQSYDPGYTAEMAWNSLYTGAQFANAFSSVPATFLSPPLADSVEITGIPEGLLHVSSDAPRYQVHTQLFDVAGTDWKLISRSSNGMRDKTVNEVTDVHVEATALSHIVPAGHSIGLVVTSIDTFQANQANTIPYFVSSHSFVVSSVTAPSYLEIPVVGSKTIASLRETPSQPGSEFRLEQNWPNPFNPTTKLRYSVGRVVAPSGASPSGVEGPAVNRVRLGVYDVLGRQVAVLVDEEKAPGSYEVRFDGSGLASGVYVYRLTTGSFAQSRKMVLLR